MAWKWQTERYRGGDVVSPHPINADIAEVYSEFNGMLDSDNLQTNSVDETNVTPGTFDRIGWGEDFDIQTVELPSNIATTGWVEIDIASPTVGTLSFPASVITDDSWLEISFGCTYQTVQSSELSSPEYARVAFAILVDGQVVAAFEGNTEVYINDTSYEANSVSLQAFVPVGAGSHRISAAVMLYRIDSTVPARIDIEERSVFLREERR